MSAPEQPGRPAKNADKATWLAYVESREDIPNKTGTRDALRARVDEADAAAALEADPEAEVVDEGQAPAELAVDTGQVDDTTPVELADVHPEQDPDQDRSEAAAREEAANAQPSTPTVNPPAPPLSAFANPAGTGGAAGDGTGPGMVNFGADVDGVAVDPDRRDERTPVHTMVVADAPRPGGLGTKRAGGYVLTNQGWVLDPQRADVVDDVPTEVVLVDREGARVEAAGGQLADGRLVDGVLPVAGTAAVDGAGQPVKPAPGVAVEAHVVIDPVTVGGPAVEHPDTEPAPVVPFPTETVLVDREGARVGVVAEGQAAPVEPVKPAPGVPVEAHVVVDPSRVGDPAEQAAATDTEGTVD